MQDSDSEKIKEMCFSDGMFSCVYLPEAHMRIGVNTIDGVAVDLVCFGTECHNGQPCKNCKYYVEISMLAMNVGE